MKSNGFRRFYEQINLLPEKGGSRRGKPEFIIAGLGNPGLAYENTRHNAGAMAIDAIAAKYGADLKKLKYKSQIGFATISGKRCLLQKPLTYMNNSGEAVASAMNYYKIPVENVVVIFDDINLDPPRIRIRRKGSDGGHNGVKSIIALTGEEGFPRVKIGIGQKPRSDMELSDWVLSRFTEKEKPLVSEGIEKAVQAAELLVQGKTDEAMNKYNS